ncbi:MAG: TetR/AcrR family transcriptional regulator [Actinomycetes bacterium]
MATKDVRDQQEYVDPRVERTRVLLVGAAADLLFEHGPEVVTFEAVSAQTRVARSTIYRHFKDRTGLLTAAVARLLPPIEVPHPSGSTASQLLAVVGDFAAHLRSPTMAKVLPTLLGLSAQSPDLRAGISAPHRVALEAVLRRGIEAGELSAGLDLTLASAVLLGPLLFRALVTGEDIGATTASTLVASYLEAHAA